MYGSSYLREKDELQKSYQNLKKESILQDLKV